MKKDAFVGLRTTKELKQKLETYADEKNRTLSNIVNDFLENYIEKIEKETRGEK